MGICLSNKKVTRCDFCNKRINSLNPCLEHICDGGWGIDVKTRLCIFCYENSIKRPMGWKLICTRCCTFAGGNKQHIVRK